LTQSTAQPDAGGRDSAATRRVFLECTSTLASRYNTGIQRAGRNLVNAALSAPGPWTCRAIVYNGRYFTVIDGLPPQAPRSSGRPSATDRLRDAFHRARAGAIRAIPGAALRDALHSQRTEYALRRVVHGAQNARRWLRSFGSAATPRVEFRGGDVLVLLDPAWTIDLSRELARARAAGAEVWIVVNDLIPVDHPDLAPEGTPILMDKWLRRVVPHASGMLGISRTVARDLCAHLGSIGLVPPPRIDHFYLGAGLDYGGERRGQLGAIAQACVDPGGGVYLAVGTVEPRKNHRLVLDVFERLWADGIAARLLIFGRLGWRSDELARRIRQHAQFGRLLVWFESGSDAELDHAYRHASALIFASSCEGFGLPLVEAMHYGLPVIASDIDVFREIGADYPTYFDLADARTLEQALRHRRTSDASATPRSAPAREWLSWADSARMLLEKVTSSPVFDARAGRQASPVGHRMV
jgi:glycosyltransferase involved in cell wall biosynthesis